MYVAVGDDQSNTNIVAIGAGTGFGAASIILVIVLTFVFIRRRKNDECLGKSGYIDEIGQLLCLNFHRLCVHVNYSRVIERDTRCNLHLQIKDI